MSEIKNEPTPNDAKEAKQQQMDAAGKSEEHVAENVVEENLQIPEEDELKDEKE